MSFRPFPPRAGDVHAQTRSRDKTRRLRASRADEPYVDLCPLDLTGRHWQDGVVPGSTPPASSEGSLCWPASTEESQGQTYDEEDDKEEG